MYSEKNHHKFQMLGNLLSPGRPIRSTEFLRGRAEELSRIVDELQYYDTVPFIFGERGVGKTSLARTGAQLVTSADREHIYVACAPGSRMLDIFRDIAHELLQLAIRTNDISSLKKKMDINFSLNPGIRLTIEERKNSIDPFSDANEAVRTLHDIDEILSNANKTVVIIDELEELNKEDRVHLAYFIKQLGDQDFNIKFVLVGIADNVHQLIGEHRSVPRYTCEISLSPLDAQDLMDVVQNAADRLEIEICEKILLRIALIGNGYPHFAHLVGKSLLHEAIKLESSIVSDDIYKQGIIRAVDGSIEELRASYNRATQRQDDVYKYLVWALADSDVVDMRTDDWIERCRKLSKKYSWKLPGDDEIKKRISRLNQPAYDKIVMNMPTRYGDSDRRNRYKRFRNSLMRGHVRLMAEAEGVTLGNAFTI